MSKVEMSICKGTGSLHFVVNPESKHYQVIRGNGYRWDGDTLLIMWNNQLRFQVPNAILC